MAAWRSWKGGGKCAGQWCRKNRQIPGKIWERNAFRECESQMTAAKKTVTKTKSAKKSSTSKARKRPARKASSKAASTKKTVKKASVKKSSAKKKSSKKAASKKSVSKKTAKKKAAKKQSVSKKSSTKKATTKKPAAKKAATKKAATKKAATKKAAPNKAVTKKATTKKATAKKKVTKQTSSKKSTTRKTAAKRTAPKKSQAASCGDQASSKVSLDSGELESLESMNSMIDPELLENFEGWGTPSETPPGDAEFGSRAEREADFDELLGDETPVEDWNSTTVFERDAATQHVLDDSAEQNVTVTSLVVVQEAALAPVEDGRIQQPDPETDADFEEFAAEEIISILDESLAMDLEAAAAQVEPKDEKPAAERSASAPQPSVDEVESARPSASPARSGFLSRLWRMMISSDSD